VSELHAALTRIVSSIAELFLFFAITERKLCADIKKSSLGYLFFFCEMAWSDT